LSHHVLCKEYGGYPSQWDEEDLDEVLSLFEVQNIIARVKKRELEKEKRKRKNKGLFGRFGRKKKK
jgi:hypothetical protein